jgi:hypothetical protein
MWPKAAILRTRRCRTKARPSRRNRSLEDFDVSVGAPNNSVSRAFQEFRKVNVDLVSRPVRRRMKAPPQPIARDLADICLLKVVNWE